MANRKRPQDKTVNAGHMPRTNGPCKKSADGLHRPVVAVRDIAQVLDPSHWRAHFRQVGLGYSEDVECADCGKRAFGGRASNLTADQVLEAVKAGETPTLPNGLDKINEKHTKADA